MSSTGTPRTSAAIWASTVSEPVPRSVAPKSTLNDPSSLILIEHAAMSTSGIPEPWMASAMPRPRRMCGRSGGRRHEGSVLRSQPIARRPWSRALLETAARDERDVLGGDVRDAASFAEAQHDVERVSGVDPVLAAELEGVHAECPGDVVHVRLEGEERLGCPVAAEGARDRAVRVGDVAAEALRRAVVERQAVLAADGVHREAVRAVGAGVGDHLHVLRDEPAVDVDAGAERDGLGVADAGRGELLGAGELEADRAARGEHEVADDVLDDHLLFRPEAAPEAGLDDPDALHRQPEQAAPPCGARGRGPAWTSAARAARPRRATRS